MDEMQSDLAVMKLAQFVVLKIFNPKFINLFTDIEMDSLFS